MEEKFELYSFLYLSILSQVDEAKLLNEFVTAESKSLSFLEAKVWISYFSYSFSISFHLLHTSSFSFYSMSSFSSDTRKTKIYFNFQSNSTWHYMGLGFATSKPISSLTIRFGILTLCLSHIFSMFGNIYTK